VIAGKAAECKRVEKDRRSERVQRIDLSQDVTLITSDGVSFSATLKDLSRDGFKLGHSGEDLVVGEIVMIRTGRSEARAQLMWVTASEAGGTFIDELKAPG
jgi:hypothetical protein